MFACNQFKEPPTAFYPFSFEGRKERKRSPARQLGFMAGSYCLQKPNDFVSNLTNETVWSLSAAVTATDLPEEASSDANATASGSQTVRLLIPNLVDHLQLEDPLDPRFWSAL